MSSLGNLVNIDMATNNNINFSPAALPGTVSTPVLGNNIDRAPAPVAPGAGTGYVPAVTQPVIAATKQPVINPPTVVARTAVVIPVAEQPVAAAAAESTTGPNITASNQQRYITILANGAVITNDASSLDFEGSGFTITSSGVNGAVISINAEAGGYGNSNVTTLLAAFGSNVLSTTGNVTGGYILGNGSQLTGIAANYGNANVVANLAALGSNPVSTTGNITSGNITTAGIANIASLAVTGSATVQGSISISDSSTSLSATGNIIGGNITTAGLITATGNVTGNYFIGNGSQLTGIAAGYGNANVVANLAALGSNPVSTTGNITAGNISTGTITTTGNITFTGDSSSAPTLNNFNVNAVSITATAGNLAVINGGAGGESGGYISATRGITATANITGGNLLTAGLISATSTITSAANITGGNVLTGGLVSATGTVTGSSLLGSVISVTANIIGGNVLTGGLISATSTITSAANITGGNVLTGGVASATGNITGGNILTGGLVSATGNVSGNFFVGNGQAITGILFSSTSDATTASLTVDDFYLSAVTALNVSAANNAGYQFDQYSGTNPNIYAVAGSTLAFRLAVTGHPFLIQSSSANYSTGLNHVTTSGTVTTAASAQGQVAGTLYWKIPGDISGTYTYQCSVHVGMVGNIVVSSPTVGLFTSLTATGNITGGNVLFGSGIVSGTGNITGGNILGGANVNATTHTGTTVSVTGNITGGNITTTGLTSTANLSVTGNPATITTANYSIGYLNIPQISLAANTTTALTDSGKHYYSVSASNLALTIANNTSVVWPVGTALSVINRGTANVTVAPGSGVSLYLAGNSSSANRTVTTYGMATVINVAANIWMINGTVV